MGDWPAPADGIRCTNCGATRVNIHADGETISCPGCDATETMKSDGSGGVVFENNQFELNPH